MLKPEHARHSLSGMFLFHYCKSTHLFTT